MHRHSLWLLVSILLIGSLLLPFSMALASEGENTEDTVSPRGPGAVILMIGLASLGIVGFAYSTRQNDDPNKKAQ